MSVASVIMYVTADGKRHEGSSDELPEGFVALAARREAIEALAGLLQAWTVQGVRVEKLVETMMPASVMPRAVAEQAQRNAELRTQALEQVEMLDSDQVASVVGSKARNRAAAASRLARSGKLLAVEHAGRRLFPAFQFDLETGRLREEVAPVVAALADRGVKGWSALLWMTRPSGWLGGAPPIVAIDSDATRVLAAAEDIGISGG